MRDYNFFESFVEEKKTHDLQFIYVGIITSIIVGTMVMIYLVNVFKIRDLENHIYEADLTITSTEFSEAYSQKQKDDERLKLLNSYYTSVLQLNKSIASADYINTDLFKTVSKVIPQSVTFKNMNVANKKITIRGSAASRMAIGEFQYNLKQLDKFEDIHVSNITSASNEAVSSSFDFNMTFNIKEGQENEN